MQGEGETSVLTDNKSLVLKSPSSKKLRFDKEEEEETSKSTANSETLPHPALLSCIKHFSLEALARTIVDEVIEEAKVKIESFNTQRSIFVFEGIEVVDPFLARLSLKSASIFTDMYDKVVWPTIGEFDVDVAISTIDCYVSKWHIESNLKHYTTLLKTESDQVSDIYTFDVMFSSPTKAYPISQATASVYFTMDVSRVCPDDCPIEVYYYLEGSRQKFDPCQLIFQEKWLHNIIDAKILFYKRLTF